MRFFSALLAATVLTAATPATAAILTTNAGISGAVTTTFNTTGNVQDPTLRNVGGSIIASGLPSGSSFYTGDAGYGFGLNGQWDNGFNVVGSQTATSGVRFDLGGTFSAVGAFLNYSPGDGPSFISAIGIDGVTVLELYELTTVAPISTPAAINAGAFRGISRAMADIRYFDIQGGFIAANSITTGTGTTTAPVSEPASLALLGAGLLGLGLARRRRAA